MRRGASLRCDAQRVRHGTMTQVSRTQLRTAFTLIEILIVVIILGILAAIVVPQFSTATSDARAGNLKAQLSSIQNQVELYAAQRNGLYPDLSADWDDLTTNNFLKDIPSNPAWPTQATQSSVTEVTTAGVRGSSSAAWVFNVEASEFQIYASYFNEDTGLVTTTATD